MLPAWAGLLALAFGTGAVLQLIERLTADHTRLRAAGRGMYAAALEMRLFNDNPSAMWRAQLDLGRQNGSYLRGLLVPSVLTVVLVAIAAPQVDAYFGSTGLAPGRQAVLTVHLWAFPKADAAPKAALDAPSEIAVEAGPLWFPGAHDLAWRLVPRASGRFLLRIRVEGQTINQPVVVSDAVAWRAATRREISPTGLVASVSLSYTPRAFWLFGRPWPWIAVYAASAFVFTVILRRVGTPRA